MIVIAVFFSCSKAGFNIYLLLLQVVKLILLVLPVFVLVLGAALWVLVSGNSSRIFDNDHKRI